MKFNVPMLRLSSTLFFIINGNGVSMFGQIETYSHQITFQDLNKTNEILQNGTSLSYNINSNSKYINIRYVVLSECLVKF